VARPACSLWGRRGCPDSTDTGAIVTATTPYVKFNQLLDVGVVYNWTAVGQTIEQSVRQRGMPPILAALSNRDLAVGSIAATKTLHAEDC
jgi:hypothetical protein